MGCGLMTIFDILEDPFWDEHRNNKNQENIDTQTTTDGENND